MIRVRESGNGFIIQQPKEGGGLAKNTVNGALKAAVTLLSKPIGVDGASCVAMNKWLDEG